MPLILGSPVQSDSRRFDGARVVGCRRVWFEMHWRSRRVPRRTWNPPCSNLAILKPGARGNGFYFDDTNRGFLAANVGDFERTQPFSLDFWLLAPRVYEEVSVLTHREYDWFGNAGYQVDLDKNRLRFELLHSRAGNRIAVMSKQPIAVKSWTHVTLTYDGSSLAKGVHVYLDGVKVDVDVLSDNLTRTIVPNGGGALGDEFLGLTFGKRFRLTPMKDGALDEIRVFKAALTALEVRYLHDDTLGRSPISRDELVEWQVANDPLVMREEAVPHWST